MGFEMDEVVVIRFSRLHLISAYFREQNRLRLLLSILAYETLGITIINQNR